MNQSITLRRPDDWHLHLRARFYGLSPNEETVTWKRADGLVPEDVVLPGGATIHPFLGGTTVSWSQP